MQNKLKRGNDLLWLTLTDIHYVILKKNSCGQWDVVWLASVWFVVTKNNLHAGTESQ